MAALIGSVTCDFVKGTAQGLTQQTETWNTPGINGQFGLLLGFNQGDFEFRAINYDTHANLLTWKTNLEALQGTIQTITDDFGQAWANCLIKRVVPSPVWRTPATGTSGRVSNYTHRGEIVVVGVVTLGS